MILLIFIDLDLKFHTAMIYKLFKKELFEQVLNMKLLILIKRLIKHASKSFQVLNKFIKFIHQVAHTVMR